MRNLTIKRTKSYVGCFNKTKIYIEDYETNDIEINGVPCRKLGDLKNGEEKTFEIGTSRAKVFAISDKLSKNFCNDFYEIPAGAEDIFLSGKHHYNTFAGNPFRFDGTEDNEEAIQNRKKGMRKNIIILIIAAIVGFTIGFITNMDPKVEDQVFSKDGMQITLTNQFEEVSFEDYTVCYESNDIAVFVLKESFSEYKELENYTLNDYAQSIIDILQLDDSEIKTDEDITYIEYTAYSEETKTTYYYFSVVYKVDDAFWAIQFASEEKQMQEYKQNFINWAKTVEFSNS